MRAMTALIIANGDLPPLKILNRLKREVDCILCADGGANKALQLKITPDVIIGDFDSISASTKRAFKNISQITLPDQYSTDLEKAIIYCIGHKYKSVCVVGFSGDRIDHSIGSLGCFKKFNSQINLRFVDAVGELTHIQENISFNAFKGEKISLIPLDKCEGITTKNLKYKLNNQSLEIGVHEGTSNEAIGEKISIFVKKGILLLYRFHRNKK